MYTDRPAVLLAGRSARNKRLLMHQIPRPARRRSGDALHPGGLGQKPQRESRGQSPLARSRVGAGAGQRPAAPRVGVPAA